MTGFLGLKEKSLVHPLGITDNGTKINGKLFTNDIFSKSGVIKWTWAFL